jgi:CheY-like chemotaxis protein
MRNVLIIDDDAATVEMLTWVLEDAGYEVRTASNGTQGLEQLRSDCQHGSPPALILLDLAMPSMSGTQFMNALRDEKDIHVPPIVLITATRLVLHPGSDWSFCATLNKPFDIDDLLDIVRRFADNGEMGVGQAFEGALMLPN